jgi:hypothetical protein
MDDWSHYFSEAHKALANAEEELRLIHMDPGHLDDAHKEILRAIRILSQAASWCLYEIKS